MQRLFAAAIALVVSTSAWAEAVVEIPYAPGVGTAWSLEEVLTRSRTDENGIQTSSTATIRGVLVIERATPTGFEATWTTESVEARGVVLNAANGGQFLIGVPLGLSLDRDGAPNAVRDWQAVLQQLIRAISETEENPDTRALAAVERMFANMTPETAAALLFKNLAAASTCQGIAQVPGSVVEAEGLMPHGLGGEPVLARERYEFLAIDRDRGVASVRFTQTLDPESAAASLSEGIRRLAQDAGRSADEVAEQFAGGLMHTTTVSCETDLTTGVPRVVTLDVHAKTGPAEQRERREITISRRP
jgi:hypothetical protein